jgi:hypothetical protein
MRPFLAFHHSGIVQAALALSASSSYLRLLGLDILASTGNCIPTKQLLYLPAAAFASSCLSFAVVAAVESFRLPDLWRRFRLVAACPFAMYPPKFFVMAHRRERLHGIF